ncbi:hypothetical protein L9G74_13650 [Shewanella sp. C32]|uniref:Uncharacterized protein n=1 Tax=Shewanella electrica TaxID=515560 RepID=A0ABT2FQM3_9GAMM|nr:hypothetical protein [Shewanella electrica]MCH1927082.1 hypothetical protein [Shewanella electrica]MCS4557491.1 hypothetical protein [Shewanella electrica]
MSNEALFAALEQAVPGFSATEITVPAVDERQGEYKQVYWLDELLGEDFLCYVEWKEFDPWGVDGLNALIPVKQAEITLSTDSLYDEQGFPVQEISHEEFMYDAGGFFLPVLQQQLKPAGLQLLQVGILQRDGKTYLHENPRFICVTTDKADVEQLNFALQQRGLLLC